MSDVNILKRLYQDYTSKFLKKILIAIFFSILLAGSTSSIAYLLDPAIKKIFIEKDQTLIFIIFPNIYEGQFKSYLLSSRSGVVLLFVIKMSHFKNKMIISFYFVYNITYRTHTHKCSNNKSNYYKNYYKSDYCHLLLFATSKKC